MATIQQPGKVTKVNSTYRVAVFLGMFGRSFKFLLPQSTSHPFDPLEEKHRHRLGHLNFCLDCSTDDGIMTTKVKNRRTITRVPTLTISMLDGDSESRQQCSVSKFTLTDRGLFDILLCVCCSAQRETLLIHLDDL